LPLHLFSTQLVALIIYYHFLWAMNENVQIFSPSSFRRFLHHSYQLGRSCGIRHPSRPSYSTFRRVLMGLDWQQLINAFNQWAAQLTLTHSPGDCLTIDGKALRSTLRYYSLYKRNASLHCFKRTANIMD
jgi:hypothetical protein